MTGAEWCDGDKPIGATCALAAGKGSTGSVTCTGQCLFDTTGCTLPEPCGDTGGLQPGSPWPMRSRCPTHTGRSAITGPSSVAKSKWKVPICPGNALDAAPAIAADGTIYLGCRNKSFYAVDPGGAVKWSVPTGDAVSSTPAIGADGTVFFVSDDGHVYAVTPGGDVKWKTPVATGTLGDASPTLRGDGTVLVPTANREVLALRPDDGSVVFSRTICSADKAPTWLPTSLAVAPNGTLYAACLEGLVAMTPSGAIAWTVNLSCHSSAPAVGPDGTVYVGTTDGKLVAVRPDASIRYTYQAGDAIQGSPALDAAGNVYVTSQDKYLHAIGPDGKKKWAFFLQQAPGGLSTPTIGADGRLYLAVVLWLFSISPDGMLTSSTNLGIGASLKTASPVLGADGTLYVPSADGYLLAF